MHCCRRRSHEPETLGAPELDEYRYSRDKTPAGDITMDFHKRILEWQAAHPNITWIGWGIVWALVLAVLFWPGTVE